MLFLISSSLIAGSWDGFYLSGLAGSGWCQTDGEFTGPNYFNTLGPSVVGTSFDFNKQGFLYGGALGWNYQKFCFVAGIEGSALGSTVKETRSSPFFPTLDTYEQHLKWMAALKLRVGLSLCGTLAYATGGYAGGATRLAFYDAISEIRADSTEWSNGWTVGTGLEKQLFCGIAVGIAYDYTQLSLNKRTIPCPGCGIGVGFGTPVIDSKLRVQSACIKLTYLIPTL
ncbi:MAG: porin family protein [Chlamydiia bacterium]|nr:porin family protein [Chlamydiia bacterium]